MPVTLPEDKSAWPHGQVQPYPPVAGLLTLPLPLASGSETIAANAAYLMRVEVPAPMTVTQISYITAGGSHNIDLGLYELNGSTYSLMSSTGSVACGPNNGDIIAVDLTSAVSLAPGGDYFVAIAGDLDVSGDWFYLYLLAANILTATNCGGMKANCLPLPATIAGPLADTSIVSWLWLS